MEEETKGKGFVIKDRRHFDESGTVRQEDASKPPGGTKPSDEKAEATQPPPETGASPAEDAPLPEVSFASFIFSLSTTAMYHFGDFPDPETRESRKNLPAAKQTIDILNILKTKTEGNLDEAEKELLDGILYELRMRFVKEMTKR